MLTIPKLRSLIAPPSFTVLPWPRARGGPQVMLRRFITGARQRGFRVWHDWFLPEDRPCLFIGQPRRKHFLASPRRLVYRVAGMYIEDHFRRFGEAFGDRSFRPEYAEANQRVKEALIRADFVIYQSAWSKRALDTLHQRPAGSWEVIPNAVSLDGFTPAASVSSSPGTAPPVLGTVGFLRSRPRLEVFFDVARRLATRPNLLVVGALDHHCRATLDRALADPYWQDAIRYVPSVAPERLVRYYQEMDCLVHPVIGDSCPNVVVEALACGVPVVCPLEGGTAELIGSGGIAVDDPTMLYGEPLRAGMAEAIEMVLEDLPRYRRQARLRAEDNNNINNLIGRYLRALGFAGPPGQDDGHRC
ncbi:MAG: glycosyltransferase family 4 protein [Magnetococcales bacterium]|nr:glycosyltransferase family 4 protein [Magnetococcales bacterium]